ncbi:MAG: carbon-nitrogen hydrolase family protein [Deltaproteobacteria bacterium]|nr:carbon-nitrogen hydrolase family protein [Deltaproteobacteria bacterium]
MSAVQNASQLLAVGQMCACVDVEENFKTCTALAKKAAARHASILSLPECFAFMGEKDTDLLDFARPVQSDLLKRFQKLAKDNHLWLSLGGLQAIEDGAGKSINSHLLINHEGNLVEQYNKVHLFDVDIPGGPKLLESEATHSGDTLCVANTPIGKVGLSICYDLRFPEFFLALTRMGAEVLFIPAAFTLETGKEHWEVLLRARAIENQCYVAAAAQRGRHNARRHSYGHAMIVDPWGSVIAQCTDRTDICVAEVDLSYVENVRKRMPLWQHRHPNLYGQVGIPDDKLGEDDKLPVDSSND